MKKVYFVTNSGTLLEYEIVNPVKTILGNMSPQSGCDLLIKDKSGFIYSGSSKNYLENKKTALEQARNRSISFVVQSKERLEREKHILKTIEDQLKDL